ncbi:MAG: histone deacetylase [Myxococcales bacterium]|nr:histone deacetylase [Myxococcales bacterium]
MRWYDHPGYVYGRRIIGLPREIHGFTRDRSAKIRRLLRAQGLARQAVVPTPVTEEALRAVHTPEVVAGLRDRFALAEAIELPWLTALPTALVRPLVVHPQLRAAGGTVEALAHAADGGWAINLSGGFHHARPDKSHGFCLINDVALAVDALRKSGKRKKILVLDFDLHQGDGNAAAFADDPEVFTASIHEDAVFPHPKLHSDWDMPLASGIGDQVCLRHIDRMLAGLPERFAPDVVVYIAGTDPLEADPLGSLRMTVEGIVERDRRVARYARGIGAGLVMLPAGGYSAASPAAAAAGMAAVAGEAPP